MEATQSYIVQFIQELTSAKDLIENSVKYAIAYVKLFHMVKYADVIKVEFYENRRKIMYLDRPVFWGIM